MTLFNEDNILTEWVKNKLPLSMGFQKCFCWNTFYVSVPVDELNEYFNPGKLLLYNRAELKTSDHRYVCQLRQH